MEYAYKTDIGLKREKNEDCCYVSDRFAIVADGMGGHNKGEVASSIVVEVLKDKLGNSKKISKDTLNKAIIAANRSVYSKAETDVSFKGMGSTVVCCAWDDKKILLGHIGDSRCYAIMQNGIFQLTDDHTLVHQLVVEGKLTEQEALEYPDQHVITRAVGTDANEKPDIKVIDKDDVQWLVLCSDGLSNYVKADSILACIEQSNEPQDAVDKLVELAKHGGGADNISVVVVRF